MPNKVLEFWKQVFLVSFSMPNTTVSGSVHDADGAARQWMYREQFGVPDND